MTGTRARPPARSPDWIRGHLRAAARIADQVLPPYCHHCGGVADAAGWAPLLCQDCADTLVPMEGSVAVRRVEIVEARAAYRFAGPSRSLLHALKYGGCPCVEGGSSERPWRPLVTPPP